MLTIRKWLYKPKKTDNQLLAQFFFADEELNTVSQELDSFDGRQDPERCTLLVNQLRICQDKVLAIIEQMMNVAIPEHRASRDFRAKFPDDVLQDSLAGQLWFGAECLAAGSTIMNREIESAALRPLARCLTRSLDCLRSILREQSYRNLNSYPQKVKEALKKFDTVFAEFELSYVSAMVPVKSAHEYDTMQDVIVLFCETINRALVKKLLTQDQIDDYDPGLMFTIPRLAIVSGLVTFSSGPLNMNRPPSHISELFRPFQNLLIKIKELLETLADEEIYLLERALCSSEESWEDIERQLNQLSFRDRPLTSLESNVHDDIACGLSPCSSCLTDCETACSSLVSSTPDDGRAFLHGSVRRKSSDASNRSSNDDMNHIDIPGAVTDSRRPSGETRAVRIRKCSRASRSSGTPQLSPDSLDGFATGSMENVSRRRNSSQREELGLEDSGHFPDPSPESLNMDLSPRLFGVRGERTVENQRMGEELRNADCTCEHYSQRMPAVNVTNCPARTKQNTQSQARVFRREDSGLGSAPNGGVLELYIQDMDSLDPSPDIPVASPIRDTVETSVQHEVESTKDDTSVLVEMQQGELIVPTTSKESHSLKRANRDTPKLTMDFSSNFPMFGKGKPSTELNTTRTVGNSMHRFTPSLVDSDSSSRETLVTSRHSNSSLSLDQTQQNETRSPHPVVRSSQSEPSFRLPFRGSQVHGNNPGEHPSSALNRVTGSRGIVRQPATSGSDGEDSSDLSSSASSSSSSCCSCCSSAPEYDDGDRETDYKWESDDSSDTNSLVSESNDEQEITMAIQAAELAARQQVRSQFRSSSDLVHRLFVCIAGVADQLQTNFASDLRSILKTVFEVTAFNPLSTADDAVFTTDSPTSPHPEAEPVTMSSASGTHDQAGSSTDGSGQPAGSSQPVEGGSAPVHREGRTRHRHRSNSSHRSRQSANYDDPPLWVPDEASDECMACRSSFTVIRRKHHCRNCGQIFCARCSANSVPLPRYGQLKPVRVCNRCYMFHVTPFQH